MGKTSSPDKHVYRVRTHCLTVEMFEVASETEAMQVAIDTLEKRVPGYENIETVTIQTGLIADSRARQI